MDVVQSDIFLKKRPPQGILVQLSVVCQGTNPQACISLIPMRCPPHWLTAREMPYIQNVIYETMTAGFLNYETLLGSWTKKRFGIMSPWAFVILKLWTSVVYWGIQNWDQSIHFVLIGGSTCNLKIHRVAKRSMAEVFHYPHFIALTSY
jgi:hypothetical protein